MLNISEIEQKKKVKMKLKKLLKLDQSGFGHLEAVVAVAVIVMVGAVGIYISQHNHSHAAPSSSSIINSSSGGVPCPSGYTCFGTRKMPASSVYVTFYACISTVNLTKEGEGIVPTNIVGYARTSSTVNSDWTAAMYDFANSTTTNPNEQQFSDPSYQWLYGVVTSFSIPINPTHVVLSQPNFLRFSATQYSSNGKLLGSIGLNSMKAVSANSIVDCPS